MTTEFLTAVLINTKNPERLAAFYRDILDIPLEEEDHGGPKHYGCELGDLHFAIHPVRGDSAVGNGAVDFAIQVFDLDQFLRKLESRNVIAAYPPQSRGFSRMTEVRDPDGNRVFLTELTPKWLEGMAKRKADGADIIKSAKQRGIIS